jgi:hypothetical protein
VHRKLLLTLHTTKRFLLNFFSGKKWWWLVYPSIHLISTMAASHFLFQNPEAARGENKRKKHSSLSSSATVYYNLQCSKISNPPFFGFTKS